MKIKQLKLKNYGRFEDLTIDFAPTKERGSNVTVIVGNNGAGKSQILQAIDKCFELFFYQIDSLKNYNSTFKQINFPLNEVRNGADFSKITLIAENKSNERMKWSWETPTKGLKAGESRASFSNHTLFKCFDELAYPYDKGNLPIIVSYSVDRVASPTSTQDLQNYLFKPFDAYTNSTDAKINFDLFVKWFRHREDIENAEIRKAFDILIQKEKHGSDFNDNEVCVSKIIDLISKENMVSTNKDPQLWSTLHAIKTFLDSIENIWIDRISEPPTMNILKNGETLSLNQLSQGEKALLALVGDIARRLSILNPSLDNPLEGEGVVMIDEVDLHLHPKWQHDLIDKLVKTFPNVQFILTTHSPHVISDRSDILVYSLDDGEIEKIPNVYGQDVNTVLTKVFDVDFRDSKVEIKLNNIRRAISHKDYLSAEKGIEELSEKMPADDLELLKCRLMLAQAKVNDKKNNELEHADD